MTTGRRIAIVGLEKHLAQLICFALSIRRVYRSAGYYRVRIAPRGSTYDDVVICSTDHVEESLMKSPVARVVEITRKNQYSIAHYLVKIHSGTGFMEELIEKVQMAARRKRGPKKRIEPRKEIAA